MHEFEADDLTLVGAQFLHQIPDALIKLMGDGIFTGVWVMTDGKTESLFIPQIKPLVFAQDIQGPVAANGEKPSFEIITDTVWLSKIKFEKRILDHLPSALHIPMQNACGVGDEAALVLVQSAPDQEGGFFRLRLVVRHVFTFVHRERAGKRFVRAKTALEPLPQEGADLAHYPHLSRHLPLGISG
jgi:hypothetical protein